MEYINQLKEKPEPKTGNLVEIKIKPINENINNEDEMNDLNNEIDNSLNEYRLSFGTDIDLPRKRSIKLYYQFKVEDLNKKSPDKANIMGLTFSLN